MSVAHHGLIHDSLSYAGGSISYDGDPNRSSVVSCLVPTSFTVLARWERISTKEWRMYVCICMLMPGIIAHKS